MITIDYEFPGFVTYTGDNRDNRISASPPGVAFGYLNQLIGRGGNDTLIGNYGRDFISGDSGDDILTGGFGDDGLHGGLGVDTALYRNSSSGVSVDLSSGVGNGGDATGDILIDIENINGSNFNDILIGDSKNNVLFGHSGSDRLIGNNGNDVLVGGAQADILVGGSGIDRFSYTSRSHSLLKSRDRITDLQIGTDKIDFAVPIGKQNILQKGRIDSFSVSEISRLLSGESFKANRGATFKFGQRTYLAVNDNRDNFQAKTDSIIEITGFRGSLSNLSIT